MFRTREEGFFCIRIFKRMHFKYEFIMKVHAFIFHMQLSLLIICFAQTLDHILFKIELI